MWIIHNKNLKYDIVFQVFYVILFSKTEILNRTDNTAAEVTYESYHWKTFLF